MMHAGNLNNNKIILFLTQTGIADFRSKEGDGYYNPLINGIN